LKLLEVELKKPLTPEELPNLLEAVEKVLEGTYAEAIAIAGRMPAWAHTAIALLLYPRRFVATFDPELGGGVVVSSILLDREVGDIVPIDKVEKIKVVF